MNKTFRVPFLVLLAGLVFGVPPSGRTATFVVSVRNFFYTPTNLLINVGDSVVWTNAGSFVHDSTHGTTTTPAASRLWASPVLSQTDRFSFGFSNAGFYPYICKTHTIDGPIHAEHTGTVSVITGNLPPTVHITSPANNTRFTNAFLLSVTANAADTNGAVSKVDFFASGNLFGTAASAPFSATATSLPPGTNLLTAVVTDNLGLTTTSAPVVVILTNRVTTNVVSVGNFFFNPSLATISAGSSLIWSNVTVTPHTATGDAASLEPLCGGGVTLSSTVRCTNRFMTPGIYTYFCSIHPGSMRGTVLVARALSTPLATLTKPASGAVFTTNGPIVFEAIAIDPDGIASVQFFRSGNVSLGTDTSEPFSVSASLAPGNYNVFAKATNTLGFGALTPSVPIRVLAAGELRLVFPQLDGSGSLQFDLTTTPGLTYVVEQSPVLPGMWQPLSTNLATGEVLRVVDPTPAAGATQKVYRAFIKP